MNSIVTFNTKTDNFKRLGIVRMVILLCLFATGACQCFNRKQFSCLNSIIHYATRISFLWEFVVTFVIGSRLRSSALVCCSVTPVRSSPFFALSVSARSCSIKIAAFLGAISPFSSFPNTFFALTAVSIFGSWTIMELRNRFNFLASGTLLCYDGLRHILFLYKRVCYGPLQTRYLCGSSYCIIALGGVK